MKPMTGEIRLLDAGWVSGVRSQTLWHAVAEGMRPDDPAALALMSPREPYVSIGYHRRLDELDLDACARRRLPIYRRRAGGGPVLCDSGQLFFQLIVPAASFPAVMERAWQRALAPAVTAFRSLGAAASLGEGNDIAVGDRKVSGTGAARIGEALVFVGNVIFSFDHEAFADCLALSPAAKREAARLMRRYLATVSDAAGREVSRAEAAGALVAAYGEAFGGCAAGAFRDDELAAAVRLDGLFASPEWVGAERAPVPPGVKIRSGVVLDAGGR